MRRSTAALGALLALSAALNALLLSRGRPDPSPPSAERPRAAREAGATSSAADDDRRKLESLETRIRELEADKRVLAELVPGVDRLGALREKLRRVAVIFNEATPDLSDPLKQLEYSEATLEIGRLTYGRSKDPKAYAEMLRIIYELALENPPLPEAQKALVARAFDEFSTSISGLREEHAGERLLKEVELEAVAIERVRQAVGAERAEKLSEDTVLSLAEPDALHTHFLNEKTRDEEIVDTWAQVYGLDDGQKEAARAVARSFAAELIRLGGMPAGGVVPPTGTPEAYKLRSDLLRAQLNALRQLEGGWTREQRERYRARAPREFLMLGAFSVQVEEKK